MILQGKVALVTGGTSGIGRATAIAFGAAGAKVVFSGRRDSEGEETAALIRDAGAECLFVRSDVSSEADVQALVQKTIATYGKLDCAFNNAGILGSIDPLHEQSVEEFDKLMAINVRGLFLSMKYEIQQMLTQGSGVIVNNSSVGGLNGISGFSPYTASKHAVMGLTRAAALDYAKQGIRINAVNPGSIATEGIDRFVDETGISTDDLAAMAPMGRIGQVEEIAQVVVFLCSDAASYITGQPLVIDGGFTAN
ncbi:SDR family oxidoreductase [Chroococcidiopsis sp. FACHB-1243]|uniref:SDR family oxidoreductase n=1 Tax=Chroococcidiopsis sp. [FACHB-1243] TaxID=2692781 RepID=UPI0017822887|nr:SDR family oxidoreductase [Chroococcidiopsis sp. [FACHB-1243]]MBD2310017.1 SDR family oxidoreductase [Chroococcidiopsis sp. [FACHB-1243]]